MGSTGRNTESTSRVHFGDHSSWEAPWNHMTYFWHNDTEPSPEERMPGIFDTENTAIPVPNPFFCLAHETSCSERRRTCPRKEIVAVKPPPWRNVYPPNKISRHCGCETCKPKLGKRKKEQESEEDIRPAKRVLKFKKSSKKIPFSSEWLTRWKEEASSAALADMFQSIRDVPAKKPDLKCDNEFPLPSDLCNFCNQPLSPFGFCNECLPPTPRGRPINTADQNTEQNESTCTGDSSIKSFPSSHFMDPCKLLQEIKKLQPVFEPPQKCNHCSQNSNASTSLPPTQMPLQDSHDQIERDCKHGTFHKPDILQEEICKTRQFPHLMRTDRLLGETTNENQAQRHPFTFDHPEDCPLRTQTENDSSSDYQSEVATGSNAYPGRLLHDWPTPPSLGPVRPMYNDTTTHFGVTLDVGDASAQEITVVLYCNRVLVAEAVNYTVNGEIVSAQSWALPPDVDVETLRCYLGDGKLYIVSFPLPPGLNWRFATYPAALGPPKFANIPCPLEL